MMPPYAVIFNHPSGYLPEMPIRLAQALKKPVGASSIQLSDECLTDLERVTDDANGMFLIVKSFSLYKLYRTQRMEVPELVSWSICALEPLIRPVTDALQRVIVRTGRFGFEP